MSKRPDLELARLVALKPVKDADHNKPIEHYALSAGVAWQIDADGGARLVRVPPKFAARCDYAFLLRWVQGRTVAEFAGPDGKIYAQPITPTSATSRGRGTPTQRMREAPGVAPAARGAQDPD